MKRFTQQLGTPNRDRSRTVCRGTLCARRALLTGASARPGALGPAALVALAALASACSGEYPLGATSASLDLVGDGPATSETASADASLSAVLPPAAFTINGEWLVFPQTLVPVGDMDGDGYGDTAQATQDFATGTSLVHIRYGGPRPRSAVEEVAFDRDGAYLAFGERTLTILTLSSAGDVDGDGHDDLIIKTTECETTEPGSGAYLVYGGPERLSGTRALADVATRFLPPIYTGTPDGNSCGSDTTAIGAGDLDGDGMDDLVITFAPQSLRPNGNVVDGQGQGSYLYYGRRERFTGEVPLSAAEAVIELHQPRVNAFALDDVTGDGLADLLVASQYDLDLDVAPAYLIPGRPERWSGHVGAPDIGVILPNVYIEATEHFLNRADIDGDGITDLLLRDGTERQEHVFYGGPELLAAEFDFSRADAVLASGDARPPVYTVGDLDGDGDSELVDQFFISTGAPDQQEVAILSGSRTRLAGSFVFAEDEVRAAIPNGRYDLPERLLTQVLPAGDLDGDGADDLFTTSEIHEPQGDGYVTTEQRIHVHYGVKAAASGSEPR